VHSIAQVRGSNKLMLGEAERSIHDALCVIRCLVKKKFVIAGECMLGCWLLSLVYCAPPH
jgi:chaperonin GroEL (HSP60 family)